MGVENQGAPVFTIEGNAGAISSRASTVRTRSSDYSEIARALDSISTEGWIGRAADRFRERFSVEPQRWQEASGGFSSAAGALDSYADNLTHAQDSAAACRALYEEGNRVTEQARAAYEAEVARGMQEKAAWEAVNGLGTFAVTIAPFVDPDEPMRQDAINTFNQTVASLDECAQACAQTIRSACEFAPAKRNWLESGLAFVGGILVGAGEAVGDLLNLITGPQGFMLDSLTKLATGDLTPDEAVAKLQLPLDDVSAMLSALKKDPLEFGKQIGKGVLDWDTWADDPARAVGHLVPDVAIALLTAGSGTALTKGTSTAGHALNSLDDIEDGARALRGLDSAGDGARALGKLDDIGDGTRALNAADDISDASRTARLLDHADDLSDSSRGIRGADDLADGARAADSTHDALNVADDVVSTDHIEPVSVVEDLPYQDSRPSLRKGVPEQVWQNAVEDSVDGKVRDPLTDTVMEWEPGQPRKGVWDMGHRPGHKYSDMHELYLKGEMTPQEFRDWYNDPANYRPELPSSNRSHRAE